MAHSFPAEIQWSCIREIVAAARKGPTNLSRDEKIDVGQHFAFLWGSTLEWYRQKENDPDGSIWSELKKLFTRSASFGDGGYDHDSTEELCDSVDAVLDQETDESFGALPWLQILTVVIPIVLEILKRMDILDEPTNS